MKQERKGSEEHTSKSSKLTLGQKTVGTFDVPLSTARATKDRWLDSAPLPARAGHLGPLSL